MKKDFDSWNGLKKYLDARRSHPYFREGEVWWVSVGLTVGHEVAGKGDEFMRPVLIIKKLSTNQCIAIPLSSKRKHGTWFCPIMVGSVPNTVLLHQLKAFDVSRFQRRVGIVELEDYQRVRRRLFFLLCPSEK